MEFTTFDDWKKQIEAAIGVGGVEVPVESVETGSDVKFGI